MITEFEHFTRHGESLIQVRVPVPLALKTVNSYFIRDELNYIWVDPGLNTEHIQDFWTEMLTRLNILPRQIKAILCTHHHPDHFGLAGYAQQLTGAPVYMSKQSYKYATLLWGEHESFSEKLYNLFLQHHVPYELTMEIVANLQWFKSRVYPFPHIHEMNTSSSFSFDGQEWRLIETAGHAKGQMMLYNNQTAQLICGDQVLPHITPHVGIMPTEEEDNPLQQFFSSLSELKNLQVGMAYPGHGDAFTKWSERIEKIISHHDRRLSKLEDLIEDNKVLNSFEASNLIFGKHLHKQPQNLRFAITEMMAHLQFLASEQRVIRHTDEDNKLSYTLAHN